MMNTLHLYEVSGCPASVDSSGRWQENLEKRLDSSHYEYLRVRERLRVWLDGGKRQPTSDKSITYQEGIEVFRVSLKGASDNTLVGIRSCRLYFKDDQKYPAQEKYSELFSQSDAPPVLRQLPLLPQLHEFVGFLNKESPILVLFNDISFVPLAERLLVCRSGEKHSVDSLSKSGYSKSILSKVRNKQAEAPASFHFILLSAFARDQGKARQVAAETAGVLEREWGCHITSKNRIASSERFEEFIDSGLSDAVVFVGLDGEKGERPPQSAIDWMRALDENKTPYALFNSNVEVNPKFTRHGNAMNILSKAGGAHFHVEPVGLPDFCEQWCIGLDLGFGSQYRGKMAVITLTDGKGQLKAYWRAIKDMDETLTPDVLSEGLKWLIGVAEEEKPGRKYLVIRDGICPKNEYMDVYKDLLPKGRSTLVECVKNGNPVMVSADGQPDAATLAVPKGENAGFLFTAQAPQKGMLTNTIKFYTRHNDLKLSLEEIGEALCALCFAPKLSFQPSGLPAPIYWADGIASVRFTNLQFAGWSHLPNRTRDFRVGR